MNDKKIAIVILNYNTWEDTLKEAELCNSILGVNYEDIVIVDNKSPNDSCNKLNYESKVKKYIFIETGENNGYAYGNNVGMKYAFEHGYKYALILNNDIIIKDRKFIDKLVSVYDKDSSIAVVNSDVYDPNGYLFNRNSKRPNFFDFTLGILSYRKKGRDLNDVGGYGIIYRPQGCCMMVDLVKMNEISYMDENTFLYSEESILAERLIKKGYKCACCLTTDIIHNHSKTVKHVFKNDKIRKISMHSFKYYLKEYRGYNNAMVFICCAFEYAKSFILDLK